MADTREATFEPLDFRKRELVAVNPNQYRVMAVSGEIKQIQANTAYEAFRQSGLSEAIKIERIFIYNRNVIPENDFSDKDTFTLVSEFHEPLVGMQEEANDPMAHFRRRKTPIISAIELDALMRALHAMEMGETSEEISSTEQTVSDSEHSHHVPEDHNELVSVPAAAHESAPAQLTHEASLTGTDVHGEGFDEIIPAMPPAKSMMPAKATEARPESPALSADVSSSATGNAKPIAERELTSEEIDALLNQK